LVRAPAVSPLVALIRQRIAAAGPISVAEYMALALGHPEHGYYRTRDPFGAAGDFVTAPEISQMFGELIGGWLAQVWADQGRPAPFVLAELGPGRGTLMRDALRVASRQQGFLAAAGLWLVETSPALRTRQAATLEGRVAGWAQDPADLPEASLFVVANEFFDALPVRQYLRVDALWRERLVTAEGNGLGFAWGPPRAEPALDARFGRVPDGAVVEASPEGEAVARELGARIAARGGAALIVDYGAWDGTGDTLQAVAHHAMVDPLLAPGTADLTAHVRFRALAEAAAPLRAHGPVGQGRFLEWLGIVPRARILAAGLSDDDLETLLAAYRRLTHPDEMGNLFQVLALTPHAAPVPPGFAS
jgi:NADH dehydrogenase [ubiquinone] 1 alpha subcomplex assembly factor 7